MCGFSGFVNFDKTDLSQSQEIITRMTDVIAHRGPDGSGIWIDDKINVLMPI